MNKIKEFIIDWTKVILFFITIPFIFAYAFLIGLLGTIHYYWIHRGHNARR